MKLPVPEGLEEIYGYCTEIFGIDSETEAECVCICWVRFNFVDVHDFFFWLIIRLRTLSIQVREHFRYLRPLEIDSNLTGSRNSSEASFCIDWEFCDQLWKEIYNRGDNAGVAPDIGSPTKDDRKRFKRSRRS